MTQNEISKLKAAFTKLMVNEPEVVDEGSLFGPFEGVKLQKDEYEIIEPFLFLMRVMLRKTPTPTPQTMPTWHRLKRRTKQ